MEGHDVVIHLASNPDIARAATEPTIDFDQGTALTSSVVEAMRRTTTAKRILYASGSGVYGDLGEREAAEDHGPLLPVSTYGASKLAGEALIGSYAYMFGLSGCAFRFGNVVGPRQTHGVGFDFARRLLASIAAGEVSDPATHPGRRVAVEVVRLRRGRRRRRADRAPEVGGAVRDLQRRDGRLHHRHRDRRARRGGRRAARRQGQVRLHGRRSRLEGRRPRRAHQLGADRGRSGGNASTARGRRWSDRSPRCSPT